MKKFAVAFGGESLLQALIGTPARRGHPFVPTKGCKNGSGLRPKDPVALLRWSAERRTTTPVPSSEEGNYGAGKQMLSNLRLARCKAADPWLWLAGLAVCRKREGVPLPRSGGGREGADASEIPYKHRLAHDPGGRRPSGRAFRCVGFLGRSPKSLLGTFGESKVPPRRAGVLTQAS